MQGEEQFQGLLTAQKCTKSFSSLETRFWSPSSSQDHNIPSEADTSNQIATQIVFSKVARGEGPHPRLCNNPKDCIPFSSRTAAKGGASWGAPPRAGSPGIPPVQPRRLLNPSLTCPIDHPKPVRDPKSTESFLHIQKIKADIFLHIGPNPVNTF